MKEKERREREKDTLTKKDSIYMINSLSKHDARFGNCYLALCAWLAGQKAAVYPVYSIIRP